MIETLVDRIDKAIICSIMRWFYNDFAYLKAKVLLILVSCLCIDVLAGDQKISKQNTIGAVFQVNKRDQVKFER